MPVPCRESTMERALLATIQFKSDSGGWALEDLAYELEELTAACGVEIVENLTFSCSRPTPNILIGKGKAEELMQTAADFGADTVIFSRELSGTQQRNLEEIIGKKTIDRTQLILDIFSRRAHSPEGKMQVELAQLEYLLPRLTGKGIMLSRLGGGIGTRGPGETKLEVDRRRIRKRIDKLKDDLRHLGVHRQTLRKRRIDNEVPSVALVGYTNAGKSTLLNALTDAAQTVSNGLFTTLDPISRRLELPNGEEIVLSDTVGFLHELPHHLVEAFKATLEEVVEADLLLHVIDVSGPRVYDCCESVMEVLRQLGADRKPVISVLNKIDLLDDAAWIEQVKKDVPHPVAVSARRGDNLDELRAGIQQNFVQRMVQKQVLIAHTRMEVVDLLYREAKVRGVEYLPEGVKIDAVIPKHLYSKLLAGNQIKDAS